MISLYRTISTVSTTIVAPALSHISADLHIESATVTNMALSTFIMAFAFGVLIFGPLSEAYGRVWVLQAGNVIFLVFNVACGFSRNQAELIVFRFLSGLGGSAPLAVGFPHLPHLS